MEYTYEDVQPLDDEDPKPEAESDAGATKPEGGEAQPAEEVDPSTIFPEAGNLPAEEGADPGLDFTEAGEAQSDVASTPDPLLAEDVPPSNQDAYPDVPFPDLNSTPPEKDDISNLSDPWSDESQFDEETFPGSLPGENETEQTTGEMDSSTIFADSSEAQPVEGKKPGSNSMENEAGQLGTEFYTGIILPPENENQPAGEVETNPDFQDLGALPENSEFALPAAFPELGGDPFSEETTQVSPAQDNPYQSPEAAAPSFSPAADSIEPSPSETTSISVSPVDAQEPKPRKIALILSGGGARGAFQVGAEKYARDVKGYHWDIIAGVSVGALNGAMLSMHRYTRLMQLWDSITASQVYTGGFNLISLVKIMLGAKSFYGNAPLQNLMQHEFEAGRIIDDLHVGAVSLISGEYVQFTKESLELAKAILASAAIPVVWPPVDVAPDRVAMVDGGVRNISPVGDVLDLEPDEIVIINCSPENPPVMPSAPANVLSIGMRALDIMQNEIFVNDMKEFLRINALVHEAELQGCMLHHPKTGRLLKYYPCQVIEPDIELGEVLDFSQASIQKALKTGVRRARQVLGRP